MRRLTGLRFVLCTSTVALATAGLVQGAALGFGVAAAAAQQPTPRFSGKWLLDVHRSNFKSAQPPVWAEDTIQFDGVHWRSRRVLRNAAGQADTRSVNVVVGESAGDTEKDGPSTVHSVMDHEGGTLVLTEAITTPHAKVQTNTDRFSLTPDNDTLLVLERKETSTGSEMNYWVFERETTP